MLFNVYYMNFSKVYEIKMMLSNIIKTDRSIEQNQGNTTDEELQAKMGTKFFNIFNSSVKAGLKAESSDSEKALENFKIITIFFRTSSS